jgi:hypothetical protein
MPNKIFANWGQVAQTSLATVSAALATHNAFPDLEQNQVFSAGALLAYMMIALVLFSIWRLSKTLRSIPDNGNRPSEKNGIWSQTIFTVCNVEEASSTDSGIIYKNKIRIMLVNSSGRDIDVWTPLWESVHVPLQIPYGSKFRLKGPDGNWIKYKDDTGSMREREYECLAVRVGATIDCWIGLLPTGKTISERKRTGSVIGTAIFPVKIDGKLVPFPIEL